MVIGTVAASLMVTATVDVAVKFITSVAVTVTVKTPARV